jgi:hypothetical protein
MSICPLFCASRRAFSSEKKSNSMVWAGVSPPHQVPLFVNTALESGWKETAL